MEKTMISKKAIAFWQFFRDNKVLLDDEDSKRLKFEKQLLFSLQDYSPGLGFEYEAKQVDNKEDREIIITAQGNPLYFEDAEYLVKVGGNIEGWQIICLKPARMDLRETNYEGLTLNISDMWFMPFESKKRNQIGVKISMKGIDVIAQSVFFKSAISKVLDTLLGEELFAEYVKYLGVLKLPLNPEEEGFIELSEIRDYMLWKLANRT